MSSDANIQFLTKVHEVTAKADALIALYHAVLEVIADNPTTPPDAITLAVDTIDTMTALKIIAVGSVEHVIEIEDELERRVKEYTDKKK